MTEAISSTAPRLTERLRPATERIVKVLPGPRILWVGAWALLPWLNAGVNLLLDPDDRSAVWEQSDVLVVLNYTALSVAMVITLWGTARIARRLETLRASTASVLEGDEREPFRGMSSVAADRRDRDRAGVRGHGVDRGRLDLRGDSRSHLVLHRNSDLDVLVDVRRPAVGS
ncbi:MAG: hypothetical protein M3P42_09140 [Actinomycetota bacterium]|nr:hypothetical protein [Actinomycetota bacterium]